MSSDLCSQWLFNQRTVISTGALEECAAERSPHFASAARNLDWAARLPCSPRAHQRRRLSPPSNPASLWKMSSRSFFRLVHLKAAFTAFAISALGMERTSLVQDSATDELTPPSAPHVPATCRPVTHSQSSTRPAPASSRHTSRPPAPSCASSA